MFKDKSIGKRLNLGFLGIALLVAISGAIGSVLLIIISKDADEIFLEKYPVAKTATELKTDITSELLGFYSTALGEDDAVSKMKQRHETTAGHLDFLEKMDLEAIDKPILEGIRSQHTKIFELSEKITALMQTEFTQSQVNEIIGEMEVVSEDVFLKIELILTHAEEDMNLTMLEADRAQREGLILLICLTIMAFIIAIWLGKRIALGITRPLNSLVDYSKHIASGNLDEKVSGEDVKDETGILAGAFRTMTDSLREITSAAEKISQGNLTVDVVPRSSEDMLGQALQTMIVSLRKQTREIMDGAAIIASSVSELSASSAQLAASAAENASSLSETTTTVEEVRQTAELASSKAEQMAEDSRKIRETSRQGRDATDNTIEGMQKIQGQMTAIAETIIRLSEQSQAIGQIIATVDSLSEQSNVLAVNASIEAAKAGEHGKGFSVVAQEVKSLAEQSKQATMQVRGILNEIQKATSTAVMATEQGSKVVEKGTTTAKQAGQAIISLSDSMDQSSDAAIQIAAASQQQRVGMDQITAAMESVSEASQQNATSAKQLEGAVHGLNLLGEKLKGIIQSYKI